MSEGSKQQIKKRVLLVTEASMNNTGYSTMARELLTRLYKTNKYELAELAIYCKAGDPRIDYVPWKVYPNIPGDNETAKQAQYNSRPDAQFGSWCFEDLCLEFKPDIVIDYRDVQWMATYQLMSPLREYYSLLWMPTIDASPQTDDWVNQYIGADALLAYTDFGYKVIKEACGNNANLIGVATPGANFDDMRQLNKEEIRAKYEIPQDINLIGMVARNQLRKLYPDLFEMFRLFLDKAPKELADKTFLHIHTGYPDQGWDIPRILKENGLSHKVYFTYLCRQCGRVFINKWNDYNLLCRICGNRSVGFTQPAFGVSRKVLGEIYNLYDLYLQYCSLEGLGIPQVEAAACGVPLCVVPYSGMEDFVHKVGAYPIPIAKMVTENATHREWAYPDNDKFATELIDILGRDLKAWGAESKAKCEEHYNWDKIAKIWEDAIDKMPEAKRKWNDPPKEMVEKLPLNIADNDTFVSESFKNVTFLPHLSNSFLARKSAKDLYNGFVTEGNSNKPFTREDIVNMCKAIQQGVIFWENIRCQKNQSST